MWCFCRNFGRDIMPPGTFAPVRARDSLCFQGLLGPQHSCPTSEVPGIRRDAETL